MTVRHSNVGDCWICTFWNQSQWSWMWTSVLTIKCHFLNVSELPSFVSRCSALLYSFQGGVSAYNPLSSPFRPAHQCDCVPLCWTKLNCPAHQRLPIHWRTTETSQPYINNHLAVSLLLLLAERCFPCPSSSPSHNVTSILFRIVPPVITSMASGLAGRGKRINLDTDICLSRRVTLTSAPSSAHSSSNPEAVLLLSGPHHIERCQQSWRGRVDLFFWNQRTDVVVHLRCLPP